MVKRAIVIFWLASLPFSAVALDLGRPFAFRLPVECKIGADCFIQNYYDHAKEGEAAVDYTCGSLTAPGHHGTDFRIEHEGLLQEQGGVAVVAAADGVVAGTFLAEVAEGDTPMMTLMKNLAANDSSCGVGLTLEHRFGWRTRYCHLREGSLAVVKGERVKAGQEIGRIGMTGNTTFPHVHFEVIRYGRPIDPFTGAQAEGCNPTRKSPMWDDAASAQLDYLQTHVLAGGLTTEEPTVRQARLGRYRERQIAAGAKRLFFWSEAFGIQKGDLFVQDIMAEDGQVLATRSEPYTENAALVLQAVHRDFEEGIAPGNYSGRVSIVRKGKVVETRRWDVLAKPATGTNAAETPSEGSTVPNRAVSP